jgi:MFS family permease
VFFAVSYVLAGYTYRNEDTPDKPESIAIMILAFIGIGISTSALYLASVSTCAKNFGRSANKGFALAAPISAFGLSGMWLSQVGSKLLCEHNADGSRGDIDVFRYFVFLAGLLGGVSVVGFFLLRIVDEDSMIDAAVDELERSGLLDNSQFFHVPDTDATNSYGTLSTSITQDSRPSTGDALHKSLAEQEQRKKTWLLNAETHRFLTDPTMWWLAAAFFLISGPGDAFINNFGTVLGTLYPSPESYQANDPAKKPLPLTSPATHITIIAVGSTIARLLSGTLSDLLALPADPHQHRRGPASLATSLASLNPQERKQSRFAVSRLTLLIVSMLLMSLAFVILASGVVQEHASPRFALVTGLVGVGYGATFSLTPIIISCVWGVENFSTNWYVALTSLSSLYNLWQQHEYIQAATRLTYSQGYRSSSTGGRWRSMGPCLCSRLLGSRGRRWQMLRA